MLQYGADPNIKDKDRYSNGNTLLHLAAQKGNKEIIELLLQYGANRNLKNKQGLTASQISKNETITNFIDYFNDDIKGAVDD